MRLNLKGKVGSVGWEAGTRTPIRRSRVCSLTIRRPPKTLIQCNNSVADVRKGQAAMSYRIERGGAACLGASNEISPAMLSRPNPESPISLVELCAPNHVSRAEDGATTVVTGGGMARTDVDLRRCTPVSG